MGFKLEFSAPSKTFLLGEYLALIGGPTLVLNTQPRFKLVVTSYSSEKSLSLFHTNSPAQRYIKKHAGFFDQYQLEFHDPHQQLGGLGASSAQFFLVYACKNYLEGKEINIHSLLAEYHDVCSQGKYQPSGADVVAQFTGNLVYFDQNTATLEKFTWPFSTLSPVLIRTDNKISTHDYLDKIQQLDVEGLEIIVQNGHRALLHHDGESFSAAINQYGIKLAEKNLICSPNLKLLDKLKQHHAVVAAKGCGALGADIILALVKNFNMNDFLNWADLEKITLIKNGIISHEGLAVRNLASPHEELEVILVNSQDQQIGLQNKLVAHQQGLLHRAFSVFIFRKYQNQIEVLLQQRASNKYHSPNLWSNACCSHPRPGESILQNAQQRLLSEMGIDVPLHEIGIFSYKADCGNQLTEHEVDHVFIGLLENENVKFDPTEVGNYQWLSISQLQQELADHPEKYTAWLKESLQLILDKDGLKKYLIGNTHG